MSMADIRITQSALEQLNALDNADAQAVDAAIQAIDEGTTREPVRLPGAPPGTSYLALPTRRNPGGPVIIYRPLLPNEGDGWLVVSLLKPEEYRDLRQAEELVATSSAAREIVNAIVAGTVGTVKVSAPRGGATTQPAGVATTVNPSGKPPR
jgi:hypothetical protein